MKKLLVYLLPACIAVLPLAARGEGEGIGLFDSIVGSGKIVEKELGFRDFSSISVGYGMKLEIRKSSGYRVVLRTDDNMVDVVKTEKNGDNLRFYLPAGTSLRNTSIEIRIEMPSVRRLDASGGSRVSIAMDGMKNAFSAELSGGSSIEGSLDADGLDFELSGGSTATLRGSTGGLRVNGSGGSNFQFFDLAARDVEADLSGGSWAEVSLTGRLIVDASGGSRVIYRGNAEIERQSLSGGSRIDRR